VVAGAGGIARQPDARSCVMWPIASAIRYPRQCHRASNDLASVLRASDQPGTGHAYDAATPIRTRLGRPLDIATLGALLMSDEASYITGQVISVDGGGTMCV
jgi:NAD(P)-dependent dehydrogenase (short-subunit alcohol dehydrogenase family)